uniref:Uncharacterized protein n=1 Tax=Onchocerca volvulus TaxID=6282 RepID=A0A8R1XQ33_ONCVO
MDISSIAIITFGLSPSMTMLVDDSNRLILVGYELPANEKDCGAAEQLNSCYTIILKKQYSIGKRN